MEAPWAPEGREGRLFSVLCVCVCVCVCACVCMSVCVYVWCVCMCVYMCSWRVSAGESKCARVCVYMCVCICVRVCASSYMSFHRHAGEIIQHLVLAITVTLACHLTEVQDSIPIPVRGQPSTFRTRQTRSTFRIWQTRSCCDLCKTF